MKFIKSFLIVTVAMGTSTVCHAQQPELKAEASKPVASTIPPPGSRPALAPDTKIELKKSMPLNESEQTVVATPSPLTRDEKNIAPPVKPKPELANDKISAARSLSPENLKTLNGTAEGPKQPALSNEQAPKLLQPAPPAAVKIKENK